VNGFNFMPDASFKEFVPDPLSALPRVALADEKALGSHP